jgi:predicted nucleotidyltransferase
MEPNDRNLAMVDIVAARLRMLREQVVFVGGCAAALLVTDPALQAIRATADVDVVVEVATLADYHVLETQMAGAGFQHDAREGAPVWRWRLGEAVLDLMPSEKKILGFANPWYPLAVKTAGRAAMPSGAEIRLIHAPVFVATKLDAFLDRGAGNFLMSYDLGDALAIVDGRDELLAEFAGLDPEMTRFVGASFARLLATPRFRNYLPGHLGGDDASQARIPLIEAKLLRLAALAG